VLAALRGGLYDRFGAPEQIVCDEGRGLISELVRNELSAQGITLAAVAPGESPCQRRCREDGRRAVNSENEVSAGRSAAEVGV
jgi:hypothetical protein